MPEFKGGFEALSNYINSHAIYTQKALKDRVSGRIYVNFMVTENGQIEEVKIVKGLHRDLDSVCIDLVKNMPLWIPATQRGKSIKCFYNLPITFELNKKLHLNPPVPSKYWKKKGKKKFLKKCLKEFHKNKNECNCWYKFILYNYNDHKLNELNLHEMFKKQSCQ